MKLSWNSLFVLCLLGTFSALAVDVLDGKQLSYNSFGARKSIYVPKVPGKAVIEDFEIFYNGKRPIPGKKAAPTRVEISRDAQWLYLHVIAEEPQKVRDNNKIDNGNLWRGDLFEIFFGDVEPEPWCMQFVVGAGGGRFSDAIPLCEWSARSKVHDKGYELFISIPLKILKKNQSGIGFNIGRQRLRELSSWARLSHAFHEPENFGELLLDDYENVFETRYAVSGKGINTREKFEQAVLKRSVPATALRYGPRLLYPAQNRVTVSWESCGRTLGRVEYRKAGTTEFKRVASNVVNGMLVPTAVHRAELTGLEPDTEYEYRVSNRTSVVKVKQTEVSKIFKFRSSPDKAKDFSCVFFTDGHGCFEKIGNLLRHPEIRNASMVFNLGDMHSMFTGVDAIQRGFLDVQTRHLAGSRPLIFVRGNHETRGVSNGLFDTMLGHPSGRSYFLMRYGDVAFMIVDTGDTEVKDRADRIFDQQQNEWIKKSLLDPEFADAAFKVLLCHIPPMINKKVKALLDDCFQQAHPDLMLSGHFHRPQFINADKDRAFPIAIGYGAFVLKSTQKEIELISIDWQGKTVGTWRFPKRKVMVLK